MRVRQSRLRAALHFFTDDFSITIRDGNPHVKARLEQVIRDEDWGIGGAGIFLATITAGLSLGVELPLRQHWHRDKLLRMHESPALAVVDLMASPSCDLPSLINAIDPLLQKLQPADAPDFLEFDFARAAALAGDISETHYDKIVLFGELVAATVRTNRPLSEDLFRDRIREFVARAVQGEYVIVSQRGSETIELKRGMAGDGWYVRAIEEVAIEEQVVRELERHSKRNTREMMAVSSPASEVAQNLIKVTRKVSEVIHMHEHETIMRVVKSKSKTPWTLVKAISAFDTERSGVSCRLVVLLANHCDPAYTPVMKNPRLEHDPNSSCFRVTKGNSTLLADFPVSVEELKVTPLKKKTTYVSGMLVTHPEVTTVIGTNPLVLTWDGIPEMDEHSVLPKSKKLLLRTDLARLALRS